MLASLFPIINSFRAASGPLSTRTLRTLVSYPWPEARSYTVSGRATSYVRSICSRRGPGLAKSRREMSTSSTPMKIKIDVTSDSICPFCFIGKRKLDRAIEISKERGMNIDFDVQFHPFLLDPTLPEDRALDKTEHYERKFGRERFEKMEKVMIPRGKQVEINFSYGGKIRQTTDSHRLFALAYEKGGQTLQLALVEKLFNGYFEREQDIGDRDLLSEQAVAVGLFPNADEAKAWLATDAKRKEVQQEIAKAQSMGISGVPFFVFNNKYAISGAEEPDLFVQVFERICEQAAA